MTTRLRILSLTSLLLAAVAFSGCDWSTDTPADASKTPTKKINERRQARERATYAISAYCRALVRRREDPSTAPAPSAAARRRAIQGVNFLASALDQYDGSSYNRQLPVRRLLADAATYLEQQNCLRELAPRLDRALRAVALPDPPEPEVVPEEEYYDGGYDDYEPTYR
jgi:hypothetical protein